jgi:hypothetical protein
MGSLSEILEANLDHGHGLINFKDTKIKCRLHWCLM